MVKPNWRDHGTPFLDFTEEITAEWNKLGFSKNTCREWLEVGLKSLDYDFAYYLELQGYNPERVKDHGSDQDLRKKYKKFLKKQPKKKRPAVKPETSRDLYSCKICDDNIFLTFKAYVKLHGKHKLNLKDPWIVKVDRPFPKEYPGFIQKTYICEECKAEKHLKTCSYYLDYAKDENIRKRYTDDLIKRNNDRQDLLKKIFDDLKIKGLPDFLNNHQEWEKELETEIKRVRSNDDLTNARIILKALWNNLNNWETRDDTHPDHIPEIAEIKKAFTENGNWQEVVYV